MPCSRCRQWVTRLIKTNWLWCMRTRSRAITVSTQQMKIIIPIPRPQMIESRSPCMCQWMLAKWNPWARKTISKSIVNGDRHSESLWSGSSTIGGKHGIVVTFYYGWGIHTVTVFGKPLYHEIVEQGKHLQVFHCVVPIDNKYADRGRRSLCIH